MDSTLWWASNCNYRQGFLLFLSVRHTSWLQTPPETAFHPQSNWILERWHRALKACPVTEVLSLVLFSLRNHDKFAASPAEFLYGKNLRPHSNAVLDIKLGLNTNGLLRLFKDETRKLKPPLRNGSQEERGATRPFWLAAVGNPCIWFLAETPFGFSWRKWIVAERATYFSEARNCDRVGNAFEKQFLTRTNCFLESRKSQR